MSGLLLGLGLGVGLGLVAASMLIIRISRDEEEGEPAAEPEPPARRGRCGRPGVLWVDGEPTLRYEIVGRFPRYFLN